MNRRLFLGGMGSLALAAEANAGKKTRFYTLQHYYLKNGTQMPRMHEFYGKALAPALAEIHSGPRIYLEAQIAPHIPQFVAIHGFESFQQMTAVEEKLKQNAALQKKFDEWEAGAEAPFESETRTLLEAADYSPEIVAPEKPGTSRIFELRVYHSPTARQLKALHERFAGPEIRIFHRSGIHPVLYASTLFGPDMPNLTYLTPFDSLAAREKAWSAFGADPEWTKVRNESVEKHGQITPVIQISLLRATAYSPVR